jgi:voltage-gated potassium channel
MKRRKKRQLGQVFIDSTHPRFFLTNDFFAVLTIISVATVVLETVPQLAEYKRWFTLVEWVSVALFSLEYIGRLIATKPAYKYAFSFFGLVDLLSIVPTFFGFGNFTFLKAARALRILRLLRLIRASAVRAHAKDEEYSPVAINVLIYFTALVLALLTFGTLMYVFEGGEEFPSIVAGMWWSFKVFMAGIPVVTPVTLAGEILFVLARFSGLLLLGLLVGVIGNVFRLLLTPKV